MEWTTAKTKLSWVGEKRRRIARTDKHELVVPIPVVVRIAIVVVQPRLTIIIPFHLEDVAVTVRVSFVQRAACATTR